MFTLLKQMDHVKWLIKHGEPKQIKDLIKIPLFAKIKITSQALKMKCLFNNVFWGFYLNYEELKLSAIGKVRRIKISSFYLNYEELKPQ